MFRYINDFPPVTTLQRQNAELAVSVSCVLYLISSLDLIDPKIPDDEKRSTVLLCFHDLNLYAIDHWLDHLLALLEHSSSDSSGEMDLSFLAKIIENLTEKHNELALLQNYTARDENLSEASSPIKCWNALNISAAAQHLLNQSLIYRNTTGNVSTTTMHSVFQADILRKLHSQPT